jgi:predicted ester cyclase
MPRKPLFAEIPRKCRDVGTSTSSMSSSLSTSSTIRPSRASRPIETAHGACTARCRAAFPNFHAEIHWQAADGELVTTYKTYHGTHQGPFLGLAPTGRRVHFETVDVMRVRDGKIVEHWGVANLFSLMQQLGAWPTATQA